MGLYCAFFPLVLFHIFPINLLTALVATVMIKTIIENCRKMVKRINNRNVYSYMGEVIDNEVYWYCA